MKSLTDEFLKRLRESDAATSEELIHSLAVHSLNDLNRLAEGVEAAMEQKYREIVFGGAGQPVLSQAQSWLRAQCGRPLTADDKGFVARILTWLRRRYHFVALLEVDGEPIECSVAIIRDPRHQLDRFCVTAAPTSLKRLLVRAELPDALSLFDASATSETGT